MSDTPPDDRYEVGRVVTEYGLDEVHGELAARWLGEDGEAEDLQRLADAVNVAALGAAMADADLDPLAGEVRNAYRLLTDDDVSAAMRAQQRNRLEREGVDVDAVTDDFVTSEAVHAYLTEVLGVSNAGGTGAGAVETYGERIDCARDRVEAVTADSLDALVAADAVTLGDYEVSVDVQAYCHDCDSRYAVSALLERGGCDCPPSV